jgi:hypothetical protein
MFGLRYPRRDDQRLLVGIRAPLEHLETIPAEKGISATGGAAVEIETGDASFRIHRLQEYLAKNY